jgi:hypothetical protein
MRRQPRKSYLSHAGRLADRGWQGINEWGWALMDPAPRRIGRPRRGYGVTAWACGRWRACTAFSWAWRA